MNDETPTPDRTPATPAAPTPPPLPTAEAPTVPVAGAATASSVEEPTAASTERRRPGRKRALLIGGGIAAAVVLAGGGVAVGAAFADEWDDDDRASVTDTPRSDDVRQEDDGRTDDDDRSDDDDRTSGSSSSGGAGTSVGTSSADELIAIADAARGVAAGDVTSLDAKRDGTWEVQLTDGTGRETEVSVGADGTARVVETDDADDDDTAPAWTLDEATIRALVAAALAEADGLITDIDADDDAGRPYDVSVLTSDRRSIDIDFGADFAVVGVDIDD